MSEARILFRHIAIRNVRNLHHVELEPAERVNVISGRNGQGKTSLLEALYFLATTRSFRTERPQELVTEGAELASVRARIVEGREERTQRAILGPRTRKFFVDDRAAPRLSSYATTTPVVAFHPGDLELVSGAEVARRRLLDRVALYVEPLSGYHRRCYQKAQRERQRSLEMRGAASQDLEAYERIMAEHGALLTRYRAEAARQLTTALGDAFSEIATPELSVGVAYRPGGSADREHFEQELYRHRTSDLRAGSARFGPQRDALELSIDGKSARHRASQGQQRILTLALKVAELSCVKSARQVHPVLLLDDVSSELDADRTEAVYRLLGRSESQIFVTTTRPELFATPSTEGRKDFTVEAGDLDP